jgi:CDGSH-type Zn-finger protein
MGNFRVVVRRNGPLRLEGAEIEIVDESGRSVVSLCRCGQSQNKPFCDGTHAKVGFQSAPDAFDLPPMPPKPTV